MKDDWNVINKTITFLQQADIPLTREALVIMLDEGIVTQETKFTYYIIGKNVYEAFSQMEKHIPSNEIEYTLTKGLDSTIKNKLLLIWKNYNRNI